MLDEKQKNDLSEVVENALKLLTLRGIKLIEQRELQFGTQLFMVDLNSGEDICFNIYCGKKGISFTSNRNDSELHKKISESMNSPVNENKAPYSIYIGTDESGKGDFFGPLVVAGFKVDSIISGELEQLGVKDCKRLGDDSVCRIAEVLKDKYQRCCSTFIIEPETYNKQYSFFRLQRKNLNHLLAWGHASVIESFMEKGQSVEGILSDQFGDIEYMQRAMYEKGRKINLIQRIKAEEDIAVASASILARSEFLKWLDDKSKEYGIKIPKGAGSEAVYAACEIVQNKGVMELKKIVKVHFKNSKSVLKIIKMREEKDDRYSTAF